MIDFRMMNEVYVRFDRTTFPLISITFTGARATDENFKVYLDGLEANYERQEKLVLLFDAEKALFPGLSYQKQQGQWMKAHDTTIRKYCCGIAYVVPDLFLRKALELIFAIGANPVPFKVFKNRQEGERWLRKQLEQTGA